MDLRLSEDQEMFKKVAADFVQAEAPTTMLTQQFLKKETFLPDLYAKIAGLGWLGMLVPEQYGGAELSYLDCGVVFEELGRELPCRGRCSRPACWRPRSSTTAAPTLRRKPCCRPSAAANRSSFPAIGDHGAHWGPETVTTTLSQIRRHADPSGHQAPRLRRRGRHCLPVRGPDRRRRGFGGSGGPERAGGHGDAVLWVTWCR